MILVEKFVFLLAANLLFLPVISTKYLKYNDDYEDVHEWKKYFKKGFNPFSISAHIQKTIKRMLKQMPEGWPEYGIPSLAPYRNKDIEMNFKADNFTCRNSIKNLQVFNLNNMKINNVNFHLRKRHIEFDFIFPSISAMGKFDFYFLVELLDLFGVPLDYIAKGDFKFIFEHLRISGSLRFKLPKLNGSLRIYDIQMALQMGNIRSEAHGVLNSRPITKEMNNFIGEQASAMLKKYEHKINWLLAEFVQTQIKRAWPHLNIWKFIF